MERGRKLGKDWLPGPLPHPGPPRAVTGRKWGGAELRGRL